MFFNTGPGVEEWLAQRQPQMPGERPPVVLDGPPMGEKKKGGSQFLKTLLGGVLDGVASYYDAPPGYAISLQMRRQAEAEARAAQAKRAAELEDWQTKERFKRENLPPARDETYEVILGRLGQGAADEYLRRKGDPFVNMTLPGDRFYSGPSSGISAAMGASPSAGNPPPVMDEASYNAIPPGGQYRHPDGSIRTKGGGSGNATGGFPR